MINAIPQQYSAQELKVQPRYVCPLCHSQSVSDNIDIGWVYCPMIGHKPICVGCCIDYQKVARAVNFVKHPFYSLFEDTSKVTGETPESLRVACLLHQERISLEEIKKRELLDEHIQLLQVVQERIANLYNSENSK